MRNGHFTINRTRVAGPFAYWTYRLTGWLRGRRIRKQFKSEVEASGAKARYEIEAANAITAGLNHVKPVNTALAVDQVREAEAAFHRLGKRSLSFAVDWFLDNYRPPVIAKALPEAVLAFREDRAMRVRSPTLSLSNGRVEGQPVKPCGWRPRPRKQAGLGESGRKGCWHGLVPMPRGLP